MFFMKVDGPRPFGSKVQTVHVAGARARPAQPCSCARQGKAAAAASVGELIPRPAFLIRRAEYRQFLQMLRERGLVGFRDPRTLPKHPMTGLVVDIQ